MSKGFRMARPFVFFPRTAKEKADHALRMEGIEPYGSPRKVWVEDGHVLVETYEGKIVSITPEVAIELGRTISEAGTESLINRVLENSADAGDADDCE